MAIRERLNILSGSKEERKDHKAYIVLSSAEGKYYRIESEGETISIREEFNDSLRNLREDEFPKIRCKGSVTVSYTSPQLWYWPVVSKDKHRLDRFLNKIDEWDQLASFTMKFGKTSIVTIRAYSW